MEDKLIKLYNNYAFHVVIFCTISSLFVGACIYVFLRPSEPIFFDWLNKIGLQETMGSIRAESVIWHTILPEWVVYSLPNGLWAFSYSTFITYLWSDSTSKIKFLWMGTIPLVVFGFELLQFTGNVPGIFCWQDLIFLAAGMLVGFFLGINFIKNKYHGKKFR